VSIGPRPIALRLSFRFFVALIGWLGDDCAGAAAGTLHRPFLAGKGELIINQPRPEERAPKSGLPDFGISMVSKSATADFDRASRRTVTGEAVPVSILRDAVLRTAPQDEVG
jgi:hypothetical protein